MADVTLDTFYLDEKDELQRQYGIKRRQHTHGSFLSHLSLDARHREQDKVNLRAPDSEPEEALVPAVPSFVLRSTIVGDNMSGGWVGAGGWKLHRISHTVVYSVLIDDENAWQVFLLFSSHHFHMAILT